MPILPPPFAAIDRYILLLAHPDDEVYSAALIQRLLAAQKSVHLVYATSGDAKGLGAVRQQELQASLALIGLPAAALHLLQVPERAVLDELATIVAQTLRLAQQLDRQCLIGHAYEGGHEAHDGLAFCGAEVAQKAHLRHFVYPLYHGKPPERQGARFIPAHQHDQLAVALDQPEAQLKTDIIRAHASQAGHFEGLMRSAPDYLELLQRREVYREVIPPYDFGQKPCAEVGYEFHRNGFTFSDFQAAMAAYQADSPL